MWRLADYADAFHDDVKCKETTLQHVELAEELILSLLVRLESLIESRTQITKKMHRVWNFSRDNAATMSRVIALQQHAKNLDLVKFSQNNPNTCALENLNNNLIVQHEN